MLMNFLHFVLLLDGQTASAHRRPVIRLLTITIIESSQVVCGCAVLWSVLTISRRTRPKCACCVCVCAFSRADDCLVESSSGPWRPRPSANSFCSWRRWWWWCPGSVYYERHRCGAKTVFLQYVHARTCLQRTLAGGIALKCGELSQHSHISLLITVHITPTTLVRICLIPFPRTESRPEQCNSLRIDLMFAPEHTLCNCQLSALSFSISSLILLD